MRITGTIQNAKTEKPVYGALITLSIGNTKLIEATPSTDGTFDFEFDNSVLSGTDDTLTCKVQKNGFRKQTVTYDVMEPEEEIHLDVELRPITIKWKRVIRWALIVLLALLLLALLGYGVYRLFFAPGPPPPAITKFNVSPAAVAANQPVTLTWKTDHSVKVKLQDKAVELNGSVTVKPEKTIEYTLTAEGEDGTQISKKQMVEILPPPEITTFTATPEEIHQWESTTLHWETKNAKRLFISSTGETRPQIQPPPAAAQATAAQATAAPKTTSSPVESDTPPGTEKDLNGTAEVFPMENTTYLLTAENHRGIKTTRTLKVKVLVPPEILSFTTSALQISKGETAILKWNTQNALTVTLNGDSAAPYYSKEVAPEKTTTYELVVKNKVGERRKSLTISIVAPQPKPKPDEPPPPPKINRFLIKPEEIARGQEAVISWVTQDAATVLLNGKRVETIGSMPVLPELKTSYTITAINKTDTVTWTRTLEVLSAGCTVILFELENYKGRYREFVTDAPEIGELDNDVSSLKIIGNCGVKAYSAKHFKATHQVFTQSIPRLRGTWVGNDTISSIKIINVRGD